MTKLDGQPLSQTSFGAAGFDLDDVNGIITSPSPGAVSIRFANATPPVSPALGRDNCTGCDIIHFHLPTVAPTETISSPNCLKYPSSLD